MPLRKLVCLWVNFFSKKLKAKRLKTNFFKTINFALEKMTDCP